MNSRGYRLAGAWVVRRGARGDTVVVLANFLRYLQHVLRGPDQNVLPYVYATPTWVRVRSWFKCVLWILL